MRPVKAVDKMSDNVIHHSSFKVDDSGNVNLGAAIMAMTSALERIAAASEKIVTELAEIKAKIDDVAQEVANVSSSVDSQGT